jgi:hypothetical protein
MPNHQGSVYSTIRKTSQCSSAKSKHFFKEKRKKRKKEISEENEED